jgi:hypothetical protein
MYGLAAAGTTGRQPAVRSWNPVTGSGIVASARRDVGEGARRTGREKNRA